MEFTTFLWTTFAAFLTLAVFSFLYKDNPMYMFAEHLFVGVSAGYFVIILWHGALVPNLFKKLADGDWYLLWLNASEWWYFVPFILGVMMFARFFKKSSWISRWPLAMYIGISTGLAIPLEMANRVNRQLWAMMEPINWSSFWGERYLDIGSGYSELLIFVGTIAGLVYFFFSKAHTGAFGAVAKFGIWTLMIGFGASFGFTVMARISLFIDRIQYLDIRWGQAAFDATDIANENYHAGFQAMFWAVWLIFLVYAVFEFKKYMNNKDKPSQPESTQA